MKIVLAGYFGFGNFGDEAILKYAVDILMYYYKMAEISIITNNPYIAKKMYNAIGIYRFDVKNVINSIKNSDVLIFPGGSVLQDVTSMKSICYYWFLIILALIFKKKVILLAQGVGPLDKNISKKITYKLLKKVSIITLRDEKSFKLLNDNGIECKQTADLLWAFTQNPKKEEKNEIVYGDIACQVEKKKIGLQLRHWNTLDIPKLKLLAKAVLKKFHYIEFDYKLICLQKNSDENILIELGKIMHEMQPEAKIELIMENSIDKNIEILQSLDYMVAMRFHAGLCTINAEKPLLMISYDPKTEEFCKELGLQYIDVNNITEQSLDEKLRWLKDFNPTRTALKTNILVKKSQQNVDFLIEEMEK